MVGYFVNFPPFFCAQSFFVRHADAYLVLPGGFGTMDELTEVLTLIQTGKCRRIPIILVGSKFCVGMLDWCRTQLITTGMIAEKDLNLIQVIDDPAQIVDAVFNFYDKGETSMADSAERHTDTGTLL